VNTDSASIILVSEIHQSFAIPYLDSGILVKIERLSIISKYQLVRASGIRERQVIPQTCVHDIFLWGINHVVIAVCYHNVQRVFFVVWVIVATPSAVVLGFLCASHWAFDIDKFHSTNKFSFSPVVKDPWSFSNCVETDRIWIDLGPNGKWFIFGCCVYKYKKTVLDSSEWKQKRKLLPQWNVKLVSLSVGRKLGPRNKWPMRRVRLYCLKLTCLLNLLIMDYKSHYKYLYRRLWKSGQNYRASCLREYYLYPASSVIFTQIIVNIVNKRKWSVRKAGKHHVYRVEEGPWPCSSLFYAHRLCMNYTVAMLLLVTRMSTHILLMYFSILCAGSTPK